VARIGIEWVQKYNGLAGNLSNTKAQAEGFLNTLSGVKAFNWGDDLAWDRDFEEQGRGTPTQGTDAVWVDNVDIVFFSGHGSTDRFYFGQKIDDAVAKNTEIRWGARDLEWIALDACNVLERDGVFDRWGVCGGHRCGAFPAVAPVAITPSDSGHSRTRLHRGGIPSYGRSEPSGHTRPCATGRSRRSRSRERRRHRISDG
jgi:hypothetical protein